MDDRTWWALQISLAIFVSASASIIYIYGFGLDPFTAISGSVFGSWLAIGVNLLSRNNS